MYLRKNCINKNFEGWNVATLDDITVKIWDGTHATPKYMETGIPFYSVENVTADDFKNNKYISEEEYNHISRTNELKFGDILMTRIGSLGETKLIDWEPKAGVYVSLAVISPNEKVLNDFLYQYTRSYMFKKEVLKRSLLNAIPQKINLGEIQKIPILLPPIIEQQKIASILSTWDEAIMTYDRLKCEVSKQKTALLQKLTNPVYLNENLKVNTCEVGFSEVFERVSIGKNKIKRSEYVSKEDGTIPVVDQGQDYISGYYNEDDKCIYADEESPLIIFGDHTRVFKKITFPFVTGADGTVVLSHNNKVLDSSYAYHLLDALDLPNTGYNRHYKFLLETKFYIPNIKKQKEIGKFLDLYDDYLEQLMNMIKQLQEQKRGLMQLLLTGKVRV